MSAMDYEYLIRRANNCGRHVVEGADADIFRRLERDYSMYNTSLNQIKNNLPRTWGQDINEMNFNLGLRMGEVSAHINSAIRKVQNEYEDALSQEQYRVLSECMVELDSPSIDIINSAIEKSGEIMQGLGLYPG